MSDRNSTNHSSRTKSEIINILRMKNIKMGKELGNLRIASIGLSLILCVLLIFTISSNIKVRGLEADLNNLKEAYNSATQLNDTLQEEIATLKDVTTNNELATEEEPTAPTEPEVTEDPTEPTQEPTTEPVVAIPEKFDNVPLDDDLKAYIYNSAVEADIPPEVMFSIAWRESTYNPSLVSKTNDHGLFQINQCNFEWMADEFGYSHDFVVENIYDPYMNTDFSIFILCNYRKYYNNSNWHHVLMRYNMGPSRTDELFNEDTWSTKYSRAILEYAENTFDFTDIELH